MRRRPFLVALLAAAALAHASPAYAGGRFVGSVRAFQQAVQDFRMTGGRIVLLPGDYRRPLVVGPRSDSQLEIVGSPGARVQTLSIVESQAVTVRGLVVRPMGANAIVTVERSRQIVFRGDAFTAIHGPLGADAAIGDTGGEISHGCVRLHVDDLARLAPVPLGAPVVIVADPRPNW